MPQRKKPSKKPLKQLKESDPVPVIIKWQDIVSWSGWNDELIENGEDEPAVFHTVGFIINKTKTKITITDSYPGIGAVVTFPRGCIIEIIELRKEK